MQVMHHREFHGSVWWSVHVLVQSWFVLIVRSANRCSSAAATSWISWVTPRVLWVWIVPIKFPEKIPSTPGAPSECEFDWKFRQSRLGNFETTWKMPAKFLNIPEFPKKFFKLAEDLLLTCFQVPIQHCLREGMNVTDMLISGALNNPCWSFVCPNPYTFSI